MDSVGCGYVCRAEGGSPPPSPSPSPRPPPHTAPSCRYLRAGVSSGCTAALASSCLGSNSNRGEGCQRSRKGGRSYISILSCGWLQGSSQASFQSRLHTHINTRVHTQWLMIYFKSQISGQLLRGFHCCLIVCSLWLSVTGPMHTARCDTLHSVQLLLKYFQYLLTINKICQVYVSVLSVKDQGSFLTFVMILTCMWGNKTVFPLTGASVGQGLYLSNCWKWYFWIKVKHRI